MKVKVIEVDRYRDGGTVVYEDELNRKYFQWWPTKKVYNDWPFPKGNIGTNNTPPPYIKEIPVELEIVKSFDNMKIMQKVVAVQDESSHWYVIPNDMLEDFRRLQESALNGEVTAEDEFIVTFDQFRTGGDLNNIQLYAKV